jgi:hypothetical protein
MFRVTHSGTTQSQQHRNFLSVALPVGNFGMTCIFTIKYTQSRQGKA